MEYQEYLSFLKNYLDPFYQTTAVAGGHDWLHVIDVVQMGPKVKTYLDFDPQEFTVAAVLHNTDRSESLQKAHEPYGGWEGHVRHILRESPFSSEACERIVFTTLNHSKKELPANAPPLATGIQDSDKLVRFRPSNHLYAGAHGGSMGVPAFLLVNPFGFTSTREKDRKSMYMGFMGNFEWVGMLSCDAARKLIDPEYLRHFIEFIRLFGREISEHVGCENTVETDIKKALGDYYEWALAHAGLQARELVTV